MDHSNEIAEVEMATADIIRGDGNQIVMLASEFQFAGDTVSIRREGDAVILEPVKPKDWI